jgi:soluble lytic murein transglycosylase-like protein
MTTNEIINLVRETARRFGINEEIAVAQIWTESRYNPNARSPAGARGVAQFMPATARRFGLNNPSDPVASMNAWGKYMTFLLRRFNGNYSFALAGYNAGEGNVDKYKGVPPFKETRNYVASILSRAGVDKEKLKAPSQTAQSSQPKPELSQAEGSSSNKALTVVAVVVIALLLGRR